MRKLGVVLGLTALAIATSAAADENKCVVRQFAELKVTMLGPRPLVDVQLNGKTVRFTVDSGAFYSIIDTAVARQLKLPLEMSNIQVKGVTGTADTYLTHVDTVTLAGADLSHVPFVVASVSDFGGNSVGLLGQNILGLGDVEYDLPHGFVRLFRTQNCGRNSLAYWSAGQGVAVVKLDPRDERSRLSTGHGKLNGQDLKVTFDSGAGKSLLSTGAAARAGVHPGAPNVKELGFSSGVGRRLLKTYAGVFENFQLDSEELRNVRISFGDMAPETDMLLGADFFISHRIFISNTQHRAYITYEGGPIFSTSPKVLERDPTSHTEVAAAPQKDSGTEPTDADGFARRGAARLSAGAVANALADLDKAVSAAPDSEDYRLLRARARLANRQPFLALADLTAVLDQHPANADALLLRALARIAEGKADLARADLDAADHVLPAEAEQRLEIGRAYAAIDAFGPASSAFSQWLKSHPDSSGRATAFAHRCRAEAFLGRDLDRAVGDCNRALDITPRNENALEGRGLARLRQGKADMALKDLDAVVQAHPKWGEAQYLRGMARQAAGQAEDGRADQITALATGPRLGERMKALGLDTLAQVPPAH
jgi:tetratricopeptide (TPR) repeat protein